MESVYQWIVSFIISLAGKYPLVVTIVSVIGVLRLIFKPVFTFLRAITDAIPGQADNKLVDDIEKSKVVEIIRFVLDLFASVKLPEKK